MNNDYLEKWTDMVKKVQEPLQAMTELNIKTLQNLAYLKPEEVAQLKKPEDFLETQVQVFVKNSHKALDHLQKSFQIMEKAALSLVEKSKAEAKKAI